MVVLVLVFKILSRLPVIISLNLIQYTIEKKMLTCAMKMCTWWKWWKFNHPPFLQSLTIRKYKEILTQGQLFYPKWISLIFCEAHLVPLNMATMASTFLRNRQKIVFYYLRCFFNLPKAIPRFGDVLWSHFTLSKCNCIKVWATLCRLLRTHISDSDLQFAHPGVMSK